MENLVNEFVFAVLTHPFTWVFLALTASLFLIQGLVRRERRSQRAELGSWEAFGVENLHPLWRVGGALLWVALFCAFFLGLCWTIYSTAAEIVTGITKDYRLHLLTLAAMTAGLSASIALLFSLIRTKNLEASTKAELQGLVTDRLNKAVEGLGAQKEVNRIGRNVRYKTETGKEYDDFEWKEGEDVLPKGAKHTKTGEWSNYALTEPNLEVRIGAIYALERIAKENKDYHVQVMEILCAYVRENAPASEAKTWPKIAESELFDGFVEDDFGNRLEVFKHECEELERVVQPRADIQAALTVIGRRNDLQIKVERDIKGARSFQIDLSKTNLQGADLTNANFEHASFSGAKLDAARLSRTKLSMSDLSNTSLQGVDFSYADMRASSLNSARLQNADFYYCKLDGASFMAAKAQGSYFRYASMIATGLVGCDLHHSDFSAVPLNEADLHSAQLQGSDLSFADLQNALLHRTNFIGADLDSVNFSNAELVGTKFNFNQDGFVPILVGALLQDISFKDQPFRRKGLADCFGDASVELPMSWDRPAHWPNFQMAHLDLHEEWQKWLHDPDGYKPPKESEYDY